MVGEVDQRRDGRVEWSVVTASKATRKSAVFRLVMICAWLTSHVDSNVVIDEAVWKVGKLKGQVRRDRSRDINRGDVYDSHSLRLTI